MSTKLGAHHRAFWTKVHKSGSGQNFQAILSADLSETQIGRTRIEYLTENIAGIRQIEAPAIDTNKYFSPGGTMLENFKPKAVITS